MSYLPFRPKLYRIYQNFWPLSQAYRKSKDKRWRGRITKPKGTFYRVGNMSACKCAFWYRFNAYEGHKELSDWLRTHTPERRKFRRAKEGFSGQSNLP